MQFKLEQDNGAVEYVMDAGRDMVRGKMNVADVKKLLTEAEATNSGFTSYPIRVGVFCFRGEFMPEQQKGKK